MPAIPWRRWNRNRRWSADAGWTKEEEPLDTPYFDSRDSRYKSPFGAVPSGERVRLTLRPRRGEGFSRGVLTARYEFQDNRVEEHVMPWVGLDGDRDLFSCTLDTAGYVGLIWYTFRLEGLDGRQTELEEYQLTVYDGEQPVPTWFGEGMTYHIFPDRFFRTQVPDPTGLVGGRTVHRNWEEEPEYRPDARGEIRNRDFFGGNLEGVLQKLDYIQSLGTETIYFCPIFEGAENHRYGTGDYEVIDPMLGDEEVFSRLCREAHRRGMRVLLDGVFNHTGYVSRYFNGDGSYPDVGAAQSQDSPYHSWFHFTHWPDRYDAWWGIYSLPAVNESQESYRAYIMEGEDSIVRRWLRAGADGWRLDVADELPDDFIHRLHSAVQAERPDGIVIGEVWEDGSNKIAYGLRRRHLLGGYCDGLMNYPFRTALLQYLLGGGAEAFQETMEQLRENYPTSAFYSAMNALGTHDTPRILTLLGTGSPCLEQSRQWRHAHRLSREERALGVARLKLAALVLFSFPGSPTVYYGDEAGMEGFEDPFNRRTYPWGREDRELVAYFQTLGGLRRSHPALRRGELSYVAARGPVLAFVRTLAGEQALCAVNAHRSEEAAVTLPWSGEERRLPPLTGHLFFSTEGPED
jgi:cyclomaltodextrinase